jgi:hypothetical protein
MYIHFFSDQHDKLSLCYEGDKWVILFSMLTYLDYSRSFELIYERFCLDFEICIPNIKLNNRRKEYHPPTFG